MATAVITSWRRGRRDARSRRPVVRSGAVSPTIRPFAGIMDRSCGAAHGSPARCGDARSASAVIPAPTSRQLAGRCRRVHAVPGPRPVSPIRQTRRVRRGRAGEGGLACRESLPSQPSVSSMGVDSVSARRRPLPHQADQAKSSTAGSYHPDEPRGRRSSCLCARSSPVTGRG